MGSTNVSYKPLDPASLGADSLKTQIQLAPQQYDAEAKYRPLYTALDNATLRDSLYGTVDMGRFMASNPDLASQIEAEKAGGGLKNWTDAQIISAYLGGDQSKVDTYRQGGMLGTLGQVAPELGNIQSAANTQQRTADIADVASLGGKANDAFRAANPQLTGLLDDQAAQARAGAQQSDLEKMLTQQAQGDLAMGGNLTPAQQAMVEQQSRAAFGSRGLGRSQAAAIGEALNAFDYSRQLQNERRGFAGSVNTMNQQRSQLGASLLGSAAASQSANSIDPFMSILGRSSGVSGQGQGMMSQATNPTGPTMFNPFSSDIMSIYSGNQANALAAKTATANNNASMIGGGLSAIGSLAGLLAFCWLAREVYGDERWLAVRRWMIWKAPMSTFSLYARFGEREAERAKSDPTLKETYRMLFDRILAKEAA